MNNNIRNIYCVGRNYRLHAAELGNEVPSEPMFFMKPSHAAVSMRGQEIKLLSGMGAIHYEAELVLHISQAYRSGITMTELVDSMAIGLDLTMRDVQSELKKKGYPWLAAKGFLSSAPVSGFIPFPGLEAAEEEDFSLHINGRQAQLGNVRDMVFSIQELVEYCAKNFGLGEGDLIYTGTPAGVGEVQDGDHMQLKWGNRLLGECFMRL